MAVQIPPEIENQYEEVAQRIGESTDSLVREALLSYLDDMQDVAIAKEHLLHPDDAISHGQLKRNLSLKGVPVKL